MLRLACIPLLALAASAAAGDVDEPLDVEEPPIESDDACLSDGGQDCALSFVQLRGQQRGKAVPDPDVDVTTEGTNGTPKPHKDFSLSALNTDKDLLRWDRMSTLDNGQLLSNGWLNVPLVHDSSWQPHGFQARMLQLEEEVEELVVRHLPEAPPQTAKAELLQRAGSALKIATRQRPVVVLLALAAIAAVAAVASAAITLRHYAGPTGARSDEPVVGLHEFRPTPSMLGGAKEAQEEAVEEVPGDVDEVLGDEDPPAEGVEPPAEDEPVGGEAKLATLAWSITSAALLLDAVVVVGVWAWWLSTSEQAPRRRDFSSPLGWSAAVSAALVFGFVEVPIKIPGSQEVGPTLFNAYGFIGNGLAHGALAAALYRHGGAFHFRWTGAFAALNIMVVQAFARSAIWLLGIAAGPPLWCAVGMVTSFAWGTLAFGDHPSSLGLSLLGIFMLVIGVALVSLAGHLGFSSRKENSREASPGSGACDPPDSAGGPEAPSTGGSGDLFMGAVYALGAGAADGSLVAFYQHLERNEKLELGEQHNPLAVMLCSYFGSFGATILACGLLVAAVVRVAGYGGRSPQGGADKKVDITSSFLPGAISGAMWAGANSCSVLASHFLGMSLAFPITQTAVAFCGLLGVLVFREIVGCRARSTFAVALLVILAGAAVLSTFGRPLAMKL